jgi:hypothetical protein
VAGHHSESAPGSLREDLAKPRNLLRHAAGGTNRILTFMTKS